MIAGQIYGYRAAGPCDPANGMRFDPAKVLLDPYGRGVAVPEGYSRDAAGQPGDNAATAMKSVVVDSAAYDWEGDAPLRRRWRRRSSTRCTCAASPATPAPGVGEQTRGTYAGLIEKIPYLQQLGITAVELLPVFQFDAQDCPPGLVNYWGYAPVSFFAPHQAYSSRRDPLGPIDEFRDMVKALHRAGIEVILDVVFNHTAEGDERGPTLCFRGLDNTAYYILEDDRARYANYTGTGNTLNANHPVVRRMIVDSLRYWVEAMHVDGFRFDLASILARDTSGQPTAEPAGALGHRVRPGAGRHQAHCRGLGRGRPLPGRQLHRRCLEGVERPVPRRRPQLLPRRPRFGRAGRGPAGRQPRHLRPRGARGRAERQLRHLPRRLHPQRPGLLRRQAQRGERGGQPRRRERQPQLELRRRGAQLDDPEIERLRSRQIKNFLTVTLLALGVPMILMGDEVRRTQSGNNNAYCQDNEISWFDWTLVEKHADLHRFVSLQNARRLLRDVEHERQRVTLNQLIRQASKAWHGVKVGQPDWGENSHSLVFEAELRQEGLRVYLILNAYREPLEFELPPAGDGAAGAWRRWIDTALASPQDIVEWRAAPAISGPAYRAAARSVVVLFRDIAHTNPA